MKAPFLGKIRLFWCSDCNIPILEKICSCCGTLASKLRIAPPGDVRPAFAKDYEIIRAAVGKISGYLTDFFTYPILLNHVSEVDRADEVISDGFNLGLLIFDSNNWEFYFKISHEGAKVLFSYVLLKKKNFWKSIKHFKYVVVDKVAGEKISEGFNVLPPGIISYSSFSKGERILVFSEDNYLVGVGNAIVDSHDIDGMQRGVVIKTKTKNLRMNEEDAFRLIETILKSRIKLDELTEKISDGSPKSRHILYIDQYDPYKLFPKGIADYWRLIIACNEKHIKALEREATSFIRNTIRKKESHVAISFSGGKDSIVLLHILANLQKVLKFEITPLFIDLGIQQDNYSQVSNKIVKRNCKKLGLDVNIVKIQEEYGFSIDDVFAKKLRRCCRVKFTNLVSVRCTERIKLN
mgnify:CR=1 FL=1